MKYLFLLLLIITHTASLAQQPYLIGLGGGTIEQDKLKGIFSASIGGHISNKIMLGLGATGRKYSKTYIPLTVDFTYTTLPSKTSPLLMLRGGYGVYNYKAGAATIKGGLAGSALIGASLPIHGTTKALLMIGYYHHSFKVEGNRLTSPIATYTPAYDRGAFAVIGFKL